MTQTIRKGGGRSSLSSQFLNSGRGHVIWLIHLPFRASSLTVLLYFKKARPDRTSMNAT